MPLTIHAAWLRDPGAFPSGQLFIWAEDNSQELLNGQSSPTTSLADSSTGNASTTASTLAADPAPRNGAGRSANGRRANKIPSHPLQVAIGTLRSLLYELAPDPVRRGSKPANTSVWLPSQHSGPLMRQNQLQRQADGDNNGARPSLDAWQITGLTLPPLAAMGLLSNLDSHPDVASAVLSNNLRHVRLGTDLLFWSNGAKLVLEILVGQHYLPGVMPISPTQFEAVWRPSLLDPMMAAGVTRWIRAMPPLCRAYALDDPQDAPTAADLADHFVTGLLDTAVRSWSHNIAPQPPTPETATPGSHWIRGLTGPIHRLPLSPQPAHQLYQAWRGWTDQLYATNDANFRICLKLEEPPVTRLGAPALGDAETPAPSVKADNSQERRWTLRYLLQARDDATLQIPAAYVWQERGTTLRFQNRRFDHPQERLLTGLGIASRLFAPIERSLRSTQPESASLSTEEAYHFLREIGPLLQRSGFGVITPDWWDPRKRARLGLRLRLGPPQDGVARGRPAGRRVRYNWALSLGAEPLEQEDFDNLADLHAPLVRIADRWVELDPSQVLAARQFLESQADGGTVNLLEAVRMAQGNLEDQVRIATGVHDADALDSLHALSVDTVEIEGWVNETLNRLHTVETMTPLAEPVGFHGDLRPYQERGAGWLWYLRQLGLGACLADDMGLGKTIQTIALLLHAKEQARLAGEGVAPQTDDAVLPAGPALLICPTSVVSNWRREMERFAPSLRSLVHHGSNRLTDQDFLQAAESHDLIITSYGTARRDIDLLRRIEWSDLILDEAQNIKNPAAKQSQAVRRISAANRVALTGTPVENRLLELWSIMEFLNPGYFGPRERFRRSFILPIERYNDPEQMAQLRRLVQPFLLRRVKTDPSIIPDLPEKNEMVVYCPLTGEQAALYQTVAEEILGQLDNSQGIQRRGLVLKLLTKLKQVCNHPAHFLKQTDPLTGRSGKLSRLTEMLDEALSVGDRALIFTQFVEMGELLKTHLIKTLGADVIFLHGGTPAAKRDEMVQTFQQESGGPSIFILSLRAGGVGLNLTNANHVFHFDRWWNPAVENQATDRAFRIGQTRNVQVYKFVTAGTLEERINEMILSKQSLAENVIGSGEEWLTEMDTTQLRDLLTLRRDEEMLSDEDTPDGAEGANGAIPGAGPEKRPKAKSVESRGATW